VAKPTDRGADDVRFFTIMLWLCAAASAWLLLSPTAFTRRALTRRAEQTEAEALRERLDNTHLERWRDALENDPTAIEHEARRLGYGRPGERSYLILQSSLAMARADLAKSSLSRRPRMEDFRKTVAPALMVLIAGAVAVLFFSDLRIPDPLDRPARDASNEKADG
jgi:hypothetical protein